MSRISPLAGGKPPRGRLSIEAAVADLIGDANAVLRLRSYQKRDAGTISTSGRTDPRFRIRLPEWHTWLRLAARQVAQPCL